MAVFPVILKEGASESEWERLMAAAWDAVDGRRGEVIIEERRVDRFTLWEGASWTEVRERVSTVDGINRENLRVGHGSDIAGLAAELAKEQADAESE